jgi:murein DD-endopeptidase MepM/ murein hydrolase activator NlpD
MKWPLKNKIPAIPTEGAVGDFAFRRSFYYHPGIDLYCAEDQEVQAIEDGVVVHFEYFTGVGAKPSSPWWHNTFSVMVEGASGVIGYCELFIADEIDIGTKVKAGDSIGNITPVLKKDKGNGTTMLHVERYVPGTKHHVTWVLDTPQPSELVNPRKLLEEIRDGYFSNSK